MSDPDTRLKEANTASEQPSLPSVAQSEEVVVYQSSTEISVSRPPSKEQQKEDGPSTSTVRTKWENKFDFLMSCISVSVGLGNVWRFPVTAFENGGGAFLIPYILVLVLIGRPIYFLELTLGQFTSSGQIDVWKAVPFFKGVGYGSMIAAASVLTYYVYIMSLTAYYFFASFQRCLPWGHCHDNWKDHCELPRDKTTCNRAPKNGSKFNASIPEMYFKYEVIHEKKDIDDGIGIPDWKLGLSLLFCWITIFGTLVGGIRSSGKVAWFTAIFPYVVLIILLIRGLTLDGANKGIKFFVTPNFTKLLEAKVWFEAVGQCFFSLNTGFGSLIMFGSYNEFHHNVYRDALIVSLLDTFTSLLAGFTIFAVLGNLAHTLNVDVEAVAKSGPGLAFISYPDAIAKFNEVPQLFSVLFFFMLYTLGLGSAVSDCGAIITIFCDQFPRFKRWLVTLVICLIGCSLGLAYTTPGGQFLVELVDFYGGGFIIYLMSVLEVIGIAWVYGLYNYLDDLEFMLKTRLGWYWKICWGIFIPMSLIVILIYSLVSGVTPTYNDVDFPVSALVFGFLLAVSALVALPIAGIHAMTKIPAMSWREKFYESFKPHSLWGPQDPEKWSEYVQFKKDHPQLTLVERFRCRKL